MLLLYLVSFVSFVDVNSVCVLLLYKPIEPAMTRLSIINPYGEGKVLVTSPIL